MHNNKIFVFSRLIAWLLVILNVIVLLLQEASLKFSNSATILKRGKVLIASCFQQSLIKIKNS